MTLILFVAVLILGFLLADMRQRLKRLERDVDEALTAREIDRWRAIGADASEMPAPSPPPASPARVVLRAEPDASVESGALPHESLAPAAPPAPEPVLPAREDIAAAEATQPADMTHWDEAAPEAESMPEAESTSSGFEDLFGRRLPIWAGGVTLLVAAVLLVKYSIDAGLVSPGVRVVFGLVFGGILIGAAEAARRMARFVQDERIAQSLAGAGVGALFAATLAASNLYGLIGPGAAFAGLCAITALAMGLALRFGIPCAVLALIGGLAAPALVQSGEPNVPLLSGYLSMVIGSLTVMSRRQRWFWLGAMALAGGLGWTALIIVLGALSQASILSVGLLVMLLGLALPLLAADEAERGTALQAIGAVAAALQLALLVSFGGYDALSWGLYGLLSLAFLWLTARVETLRPYFTVPLATGLLLTALWPHPAPGLFAAVMAGHLVLFGGGALWRLWRAGGGTADAGRIILVAIGGYVVTLWHFDGGAFADRTLALLGLVFAAFPAIGAALGWRREDRQDDLRFPLLALAGALLLILAGLVGLPGWTAPLVITGVCALLLLVAEASGDRRVSGGALVYLGGAVLALVVTGGSGAELERLAMAATLAHPAQALLRWGGLALVWGLFAWRRAGSIRGQALTAVTAALGYGLVAQVLPAPWLAIAAATLALALALPARRFPAAPLEPALMMLSGIALLWMLEPLGRWLAEALPSLIGEPMLAGGLPSADLALRRLLVPVALIGLSAWTLRARLAALPAVAAPAILGVPALIGLHSLYKLLFAIDTGDRFVMLGLAERTVWQCALVAAGLALWRGARQREAGLALVALGVAHNLLYSLLLHDPLWTDQAVGPWPLANLLLPAFGLAFAAPRLIGRMAPAFDRAVAPFADAAHMPVMLLFAYASLRQLFCGPVFADVPVGQVESICWSVLAIALAIGWLLWGIRRAARSWRIGSLALMLAAIAKVFLIDASGLEGLLRVASFLALGFSLIGIGWLYSRFLRADPA